MVTVVLAETGEDLLGPLGLAEAHQGAQKVGPHGRHEQVRRGQGPGQLLGGPERGQRVGIPAARQLQRPADVIDPHRRRGLGFRSEGALGALQPGFCLPGPPLPGQQGYQCRVGVAGGGSSVQPCRSASSIACLFLLATSVLNRMCAPLCDALIGRADSAELISEIHRANLFVIPLDDQRRWFRYHHLFGGQLRHELARASPERPAVLHRRAAQWYAEHDDATEAIGHAIASGADALSSRLVAAHWLRTFNTGQLETVRTWLHALPAELVATDASLSAARVLLALDTGRLEEVSAAVDTAQASGPPDTRLMFESGKNRGRRCSALGAYPAASGGQAAHGEVLPELAIGEVVAAQLLLPVPVRLDLVHEHRPVLPAVPRPIGLPITVDVQPPHQARASTGRFQIAVRTVWRCQATSCGKPAFTERRTVRSAPLGCPRPAGPQLRARGV
jgi:hypothetical protein